MPSRYEARHLAIICPTKDRPEKIRRLMKSLNRQSIKPAQIIIADSGEGLEKVIATEKGKLPVFHLLCPVAGQVLQRNLALEHLHRDIRLVLYCDDDITLARDALKELLAAWNAQTGGRGKPVAGIGMNVVDADPPKPSLPRRLFLAPTKPAGCVFPSGHASSYLPATRAHDTRWLIGGATSWDRRIIERNPHPVDFSTRWAICEDLIYSYPIGKKNRLLVAHEAKVRANEIDERIPLRKAIFHGKSLVIMRYYFVTLHDELSVLAFFWMTTGQIFGYLVAGLAGDGERLGQGIGAVIGLARCLLTPARAGKARNLAKNLYVSSSS